MEPVCRVIWKNTEIGLLSKVSTDMWYLGGEWQPHEGRADEFERLLSETTAMERLDDLSKIIAVTLVHAGDETRKNYCLVMALEPPKLVMRQVVADAALDKFFPDR